MIDELGLGPADQAGIFGNSGRVFWGKGNRGFHGFWGFVKGRVEIWRGDLDGPVSRSRSSNRTCGFPASRLSDQGPFMLSPTGGCSLSFPIVPIRASRRDTRRGRR